MRRFGFTLAELLIALVILGVIATFTIPKVLRSQQSSEWNTKAKEMAAMLSEAYQVYKTNNTINGSTGIPDLTSYFNYVSIQNTGSIDYEDATSASCTGNYRCMTMHNGGKIRYNTTYSFGGTALTNGTYILFDPDGIDNNVPGICFWVYSNGVIRTNATIEPNTCNSVICINPGDWPEPPWFSWD